MLLAWLRNRRRKKLLTGPIAPPWLDAIRQALPDYERLSPAEQAKLCDDIRVFVAERNWEGCDGLVLTEGMKVTIAALACWMVLRIDGEPFRKLQSVLVYPAGYRVPQERWHAGWSIMGESARLGESWYRGPVILSWTDIEDDLANPGDGSNLVWHEFAHQIDMLDRSTDGTPPLATAAQRRRWHDVMTSEYEQLKRDAGRGRDTLLDPYGTENEAEFFAVATECFFDCPREMRELHPGLYDLLRDYYRQDPAARRDA